MADGPIRIDDVLIVRYLAGETSPDETAAIRAWIDAAPDARQRMIADLSAVVSAVRAQDAVALDAVDVDAFATRLDARIDAAERRPVIAGHVRERPRWSMRIAAIGAIAAVIVAAVVLGRQSVVFSARPQAFREFTSPPGSHTTITLRDGSRIALGPASRLRVARDFGVTVRALELDGEAVFTVVHDADRPFAVRTPRAVVRDVGTTFAVRAYAQDSVDRIAVREGEVALDGAHGHPVALRANDLVIVDRANQVTIRRHVDVGGAFAWTQGRLAFEDAPLREVVREIGRTFDLTITIADSALADQRLTASFDAESADEVLEDVTAIVGARHERAGRAVVIRRGKAAAGRGTPRGGEPPAVVRTAGR